MTQPSIFFSASFQAFWKLLSRARERLINWWVWGVLTLGRSLSNVTSSYWACNPPFWGGGVKWKSCVSVAPRGGSASCCHIYKDSCDFPCDDLVSLLCFRAELATRKKERELESTKCGSAMKASRLTWGRPASHWREVIWSLSGGSSCTTCWPLYPVQVKAKKVSLDGKCHRHTHLNPAILQRVWESKHTK